MHNTVSGRPSHSTKTSIMVVVIIAIIADNIHVAVLIVAGVIIQIVCYVVIH